MVEREAVFEERQFQLRGLLDLLKLPRRLAVLGLHGLGWNQGIDKRCSIRSLQGPWTLDLGPYHFLRDAWLVKKNYPWCVIRWKNSAWYVIGTPLCHPPLSARMFKFNICTFAAHFLPRFSTLLCKWRLYWSGFQGFVTVAKNFSGP